MLVALVCLSVLLLLGAAYLALRLRRSSSFNREAIARNKALKGQVRRIQAQKERLKGEVRRLRAEADEDAPPTTTAPPAR